MFRAVKESITLKIIFIYAIFVCLQIFPLTGLFIMFGMALAGPYIWGLLPHAIIVALLADIYTKRISKFFLLIPIVVYGGYYSALVYQVFAIKQLERQIQADNVSQKTLSFDSSAQSLVMSDAADFVRGYKIPVAYTSNNNYLDQFVSYRLATPEACQNLFNSGIVEKDFLASVKSGFSCRPVRQNVWGSAKREDSYLDSVRILQMPERPEKNVINVSISDDGESVRRRGQRYGFVNLYVLGLDLRPTVSKKIYSFKIQDKIFAQYTIASVARMPLFPFLIFGCGLNDSPSEWQCFIQLEVAKTDFDSVPAGTDIEKFGKNPAAIVLGIEKYKQSDYQSFKDYPENTARIEWLVNRKKNETPADFDEWGVRKDSPYLPAIGQLNGIPSYKGSIYSKKEGGSFFSFIQNNVGKIVYIDGTMNSKVGIWGNYFDQFGVCKDDTTGCDVNHQYEIVSGNGSTYVADRTFNRESATIKGFWYIGPTIKNGDVHTKNILTGRQPDGVAIPATNDICPGNPVVTVEIDGVRLGVPRNVNAIANSNHPPSGVIGSNCDVHLMTDVRSLKMNGLELSKDRFPLQWLIPKEKQAIADARSENKETTFPDGVQKVEVPDYRFYILPSDKMPTGNGEPVIIRCGGILDSIKNRCQTRYIHPLGFHVTYDFLQDSYPANISYLQVDQEKRALIDAMIKAAH